jgi:uncharacterized protein (TIGR00375 family)
METVADLHLHSRYSVATGRQADLPHLDLWGRYKGVRVVGTGDCTHPRWLAELSGQLEEVAPGTYELRPEAALPLDLHGPRWEAVVPVRFLITGEVSTIYKQGGRVRKVHLVVVLSGLEAAQRLSRRLARIGNVAADGRPILGLAAASLTELTLEQDPDALVIPAHIWTPWFSVLGAKSGFDSLEDCFGETLRHIYALETGLSSDPAMNWRVSGLDRFVLVSNSDAHSPEKLGREANLFSVPPTFAALARAIRTGEGFLGTLEFFPEEGKYHLDGHRKCGRRLTPQESRAVGGRCPECGQPLTLGVLNRVLELADREGGCRPPLARPFTSLIGLPEILAEVMAAAPGSKKVQQAYFQLLQRLGPELAILRHRSLEEVPPQLGPAFRDYEAALAGAGLYDFEDLVARPVRLLDTAPDLRAAWQGRWRHFLVDEFQDLNGAQYRFLLALAGEAPASLLAIGDPNQAIYGFRGASPEFFRRLPATRPDALVMHFPETYRLPPPLLAASRRVLPPAAQGGAPEVSRRRGEAPLLLLEAATPHGEARAVAGAIEAVVGGFRHHTLPAEHRLAGGAVGFGDIAVLYRLHAQGELLAEELSRAGIPCQLVREGVGPDWEELDLAAARVKLLSLHAAKGLEFDYVFLTGCEDGLIPLKLARDDPPDLEEERRLFYVGLTRAREQVILTRARRRRLAGHQGPTRLSPWVAAVAPQIWRPAAPRGRVRQRSLFPQAAGPAGGPPD